MGLCKSENNHPGNREESSTAVLFREAERAEIRLKGTYTGFVVSMSWF